MRSELKTQTGQRARDLVKVIQLSLHGIEIIEANPDQLHVIAQALAVHPCRFSSLSTASINSRTKTRRMAMASRVSSTCTVSPSRFLSKARI